jgi:hypothetical protein
MVGDQSSRKWRTEIDLDKQRFEVEVEGVWDYGRGSPALYIIFMSVVKKCRCGILVGSLYQS